jgi:hypothetical protein
MNNTEIMAKIEAFFQPELDESPELKGRISSFCEQEFSKIEEMVKAQLAEKDAKIYQLQEQVDLLVSERFGSSSEKSSSLNKTDPAEDKNSEEKRKILSAIKIN